MQTCEDLKCDYCKKRAADYDAKTMMGPWAYLCERCFKVIGIGFGLGKDQRIERGMK